MQKHHLVLPLLTCLLITGCNSFPKHDLHAFSRPVKVTAVYDNKEGLLNALSIGDSLKNGTNQTGYKLVDNKGRIFEAVEKTKPKEARFKVGDCLDYWQPSNAYNPYYPQLSLANKKCTAATEQKEVQTDPYMYPDVSEPSPAHHTQLLNSWLDSTEANLIQSWGMPTKSYIQDQNTKLVSYTSGYTMTHQSVNGFGEVVASWNEEFWCTDTFTITKGIIEHWRSDGNHCR